jgi:hypothetical protein
MFLQGLLFWGNIGISVDRSGLRGSGRYNAGKHRVIVGSVLRRENRSRRCRELNTTSVAHARHRWENIMRGIKQTSDVDDAVIIFDKVTKKICDLITDCLSICPRSFDINLGDGLNYRGFILFS